MNDHEQGVVDRYFAYKDTYAYTKYAIKKEKARKEGADFPAEPTEIIAYNRLRISPESIKRHDETLIANWNAKVPQNGTVYHLGDFCFAPDRASKIIDRLNGHIFFIMGNHDKGISQFGHKFGWVKDLYTVKVKDDDSPRGIQDIVLLHYAMRVWNKSHHGAWMLYGHSHGSLEDDPHAKSFDCGVDCHNYTPISYREVKAIMKTKTWKPVDHHTGRK
jgi:calcineurin-like phosphoesterase family protein